MRFPRLLVASLLTLQFGACVATGAVPPREPQTSLVGIPVVRGPAQPRPPRPWPVAGLCLEVDAPANCRAFQASEIDAIRAAVLERLAADPAWSAAHTLAAWPISAPRIGAYDGWAVDGFEAHADADVVLSAATSTPDADELWYRIVLAESATGWTVLHVDSVLATNPL